MYLIEQAHRSMHRHYLGLWQREKEERERARGYYLLLFTTRCSYHVLIWFTFAYAVDIGRAKKFRYHRCLMLQFGTECLASHGRFYCCLLTSRTAIDRKWFWRIMNETAITLHCTALHCNLAFRAASLAILAIHNFENMKKKKLEEPISTDQTTRSHFIFYCRCVCAAPATRPNVFVCWFSWINLRPILQPPFYVHRL